MHQRLGISDEEWAATPPSVKAALRTLFYQARLLELRFAVYERKLAALEARDTEVESLQTQVAALRERLGQNSTNSSLPPSSDAPQHRRPARREASGKARGAQAGHQGRGRALVPSEEVDHVIDFRPLRCRGCGRRLRGDDPQPARRQVTELPPARAEVSEYRRHTLCCETCGTRTAAQWGAEVPPGSFGARLQATTAYLTGRLGLSHRDCVEAIDVLHGATLSLGSISAVQRRVSAALAAPAQTAEKFVRRQKVNCVDETSWRESDRLSWLWVTATPQVTSFRITPRRGAMTAREVIGRAKTGIVTTDRYKAYNWLDARRRQVCWAHLARDFQAMAERGGEARGIGQELLGETKRLFHLWHQVRDGTLSRRKFRRAMLAVEQNTRALLDAGSECAHAKTGGTCRQIRSLGDALWTFVRVEGVEPTNNRAERALRRAVMWRRTSFGTQSEAGSRFVERILTVVTSLRQQGRDVLGYLAAACASTTHNDASICLLPTASYSNI